MKTKFFYLAMLMMSSQLFAENRASQQGKVPCDDYLTAIPATNGLVAVVNRLPGNVGQGSCVDLAQLNGICLALQNQYRVPIPGSNRTQYAYEKKMKDAACVKATDSSSIARQKIQSLWDNYQDRFKCTGPGFNIADGNILKYATRMRSFNFLSLAVDNWSLNLNYRDPADNYRTVLDYLEREIQRYATDPIAPQLEYYRDTLIDAGAKRSSDL